MDSPASPATTFQLTKYEYVDKKIARWVKANLDKIKFRVMDDYYYDPIEKIKGYLDKVLSSPDGKVRVNYKYGKNIKFGRLYAQGYSAQQQLREFRHTLFNQTYYDLDMVNCQPVILQQYCEKNICIPTPYLEEYVKNRDQIISQIMEETKETKEAVKTTFISLIFGGKLPFKFRNSEFLFKFADEQQNIANEVIKNRKDIFNYVKRKKGADGYNINGSVVSILLQDIESKILLLANDYFTKNVFNADCLMFDGVMVRKTKPVTDDHLKGLQKYIYQGCKYNTQWIIKPMNEGYQFTEEELDQMEDDDKIFVENDRDGALYVKEHIEKNRLIVKADMNRYYIKQFGGIYFEDATPNFKHAQPAMGKIICSLNIERVITGLNGEKKTVPYSTESKGVKNIIYILLALMEPEFDFADKMWNSSIGKLCFKNGVLNVATREFKSWIEDNETLSPIFIDYDYNPSKTQEDINWIFENVLNPIISDKDQQKHFLQWLARGIGGNFTDKTWAAGLGNRNCGKGVLTSLLKSTLGSYCESFNPEELVCSKTSGDIAKRNGWLIPLIYSRINISNELKTLDDSGRQFKLDGDAIKSISSGGDIKKGRLLYQNERSFKLQGRMLLMMNEMIPVTHQDTLQTLVTYTFKSEFVNEITEEQQEINNLPDGTYKYLESNPIIKLLIESNRDYHNAFIHILLDNYLDKEPKLPNSMKENNDDFVDSDDQITKIINQHFIFTKNPIDRVDIATVNGVFNEYKNIGKSKFIFALKRLGVESKPINGKRYYVCLKMKNQQPDIQNLINSLDDQQLL